MVTYAGSFGGEGTGSNFGDHTGKHTGKRCLVHSRDIETVSKIVSDSSSKVSSVMGSYIESVLLAEPDICQGCLCQVVYQAVARISLKHLMLCMGYSDELCHSALSRFADVLSDSARAHGIGVQRVRVRGAAGDSNSS